MSVASSSEPRDAHSASAGVAPLWQQVAEFLEEQVGAPTRSQKDFARTVGFDFPDDVPAIVAAALIRLRFADVLAEPASSYTDDLDLLHSLEAELGLKRTKHLLTSRRAELSAWVRARYMTMTARGLRELRPVPGDIVEGGPKDARWRREVSSIDREGRVYFRGSSPRSSWPNRLVSIVRVGDSGSAPARAELDALLRNDPRRFGSNFMRLRDLEQFKVDTSAPDATIVRRLEELLAYEDKELAFQKALEEHPALLSPLVMGNWETWVIPQRRLGAEHVTDFLVLGVNSAGPQWVTVEIESPRHEILTRKGRLSAASRHAVDQIVDWREWLLRNADYAQRPKSEHGLGLHGITALAPGVVIIGRSSPTLERDSARQSLAESQRIEVHSWDWLIRQARRMASDAGAVSDFAVRNANERLQVSPEMAELTEYLLRSPRSEGGSPGEVLTIEDLLDSDR